MAGLVGTVVEKSGGEDDVGTARLKPGHEAELEPLHRQLEAAEQSDSGLVRITVMRDQNDPDADYSLVVFESEDRREIDEG